MNHRDSDESLKMALNYFNSGEFHKSLEQLDEIIKLETLHSDALKIKVLCLSKLKQFKEAYEILNMLRREFPGDTDVLTLVGVVFYEEGKLSEAENILERIVKLDKKNRLAQDYITLIRTNSSDQNVAESEKYKKVWDMKDREYAKFSPGLYISEHINFLEFFKENKVRSILDAGVGSGKLLKKMENMGFGCHGLDIADNCLDADLALRKEDILTIGTLWDDTVFQKNQFDAIVCTDVLEHIPTEKIDDVFVSFDKWAHSYIFLQIALFDDAFGSQIGQPLHLTVKPREWWEKKLSLFNTIDIQVAKDKNGKDMWVLFLLSVNS